MAHKHMARCQGSNITIELTTPCSMICSKGPSAWHIDIAAVW